MVSFCRGVPFESERSERLPLLEDSDGSEHGFGRDDLNFSERTSIAKPEPNTVVSSCKEGALCIAPMNSPLNSTPCAS